MSKQSIKQSQTNVVDNGRQGHRIEIETTVDDNLLPTPEDLAKYQAIDPRILDFLIESSAKEQRHRHDVDNNKVDIIKQNNKNQARLNVIGMSFAFILMVVLFAVATYALSLDRPWFAGVLYGAGIFSVIAMFLPGKKEQS